MSLNAIISEAKALSNPNKIKDYESFLQVFPGGYGEGDKVWAVRIPDLRTVAKKYTHLPIAEVFELLTNKVHDLRMLALFVLEYIYTNKNTSAEQKEEIIQNYLTHLQYLNNWDLVDASCYKLLGSYVCENNKPEILMELASHENFWRNRIAMVATLYHIRKNQFDLSLQLAEKLLHHKHDLIHKAVGWMLREIGNRDRMVEIAFLAEHYKTMPRTALRYAIEKFEESLRQQFLQGIF